MNIHTASDEHTNILTPCISMAKRANRRGEAVNIHTASDEHTNILTPCISMAKRANRRGEAVNIHTASRGGRRSAEFVSGEGRGSAAAQARGLPSELGSREGSQQLIPSSIPQTGCNRCYGTDNTNYLSCDSYFERRFDPHRFPPSHCLS